MDEKKNFNVQNKENENQLLFELAHILPGSSLLLVVCINCVSTRVKTENLKFSRRKKSSMALYTKK